jgi:chromosome segregation ATPase
MPRFYGEPEKKEGNRVIRAIAARSWFLVIPLLAIGWYHTKVVTPKVQAVQAKIVEDRKAVEVERNKILSDARKLGVETSRLKAEADTFTVGATRFAALLDTVQMVVQTQMDETRRLETQSDSLRTLIAEAEGKSSQYSESLTHLQARVDSLRTLIDEHQARTKRLQDEIAVDQDIADRLLRPAAYRKNSALVTGQGDFPNRDALPKR